MVWKVVRQRGGWPGILDTDYLDMELVPPLAKSLSSHLLVYRGRPQTPYWLCSERILLTTRVTETRFSWTLAKTLMLFPIKSKVYLWRRAPVQLTESRHKLEKLSRLCTKDIRNKHLQLGILQLFLVVNGRIESWKRGVACYLFYYFKENNNKYVSC